MHNYLIIFCFTLFYTSVFYPRKFIGDSGFIFDAAPARPQKERFRTEGKISHGAAQHDFRDRAAHIAKPVEPE